jgi:hypothetical protein
LLEFFQQTSASDAVLAAHLAQKIPTLKKKVAEREAVVAKLEHAINMEEVRGITPMRRNVMGPSVSQIDSLYAELTTLNIWINDAIEKIENKANNAGFAPTDLENDNSSKPVMIGYDSIGHTSEETSGEDAPLKLDMPSEKPASPPRTVLRSINKSTKAITAAVPTQSMAAIANSAKALLRVQDDGESYSAGFVTFKSLRSAQAALQMVQYPEPFAMEVLEAPQPEGA